MKTTCATEERLPARQAIAIDWAETEWFRIKLRSVRDEDREPESNVFVDQSECVAI